MPYTDKNKQKEYYLLNRERLLAKAKLAYNADHIKPFAYFPELRFDINNGRTFCVPCHRNTDTYGRRAVIFFNPSPDQQTTVA